MSPSKTMVQKVVTNEKNYICTVPYFIDDTKKIQKMLKNLSLDELREKMSISLEIAKQTKEDMKEFKFDENGIMAITAYTGIQFKSLNIPSMDNEDFMYLKKNTKILSGLYGVLNASDSVYHYRLDMFCKIKLNDKNLYDFWGSKIYDKINEYNDLTINITSKEYSKLIDKYAKDNKNIINVEFKTFKKNKIRSINSTDSKKMRGALISYLVKNKICKINKIKRFNYNGYVFSEKYSDDKTLVFLSS